MKKLMVFFLCLGWQMLTFSADIARNGTAQAVIVLEKDAAPPVKLAAEEICHYVRKITGSTLPVKEKYQRNDKYVISFAVTQDSSLGNEGFRLTGSRHRLEITGNTPRAVLYGSYALIEKFFGVSWFAPGELYEHCPSNKDLVLPDDIAVSEKPEFSVRTAAFVSGNWNSDLTETWKFLIRNRWQIRVNHRLRKNPKSARLFDRLDAVYYGGGHCLSRLIPDRLFDSHPEYFAQVNGKRIRQLDRKRRQISQPCTSHPAVISLAAEGITEFFDHAPEKSVFLLGNNDVQTWCECENCTAPDTPEERKNRQVSTRFFTFINAVTQKVHKTHPQAVIHAWGYQNYRFAPEKLSPDRSLRISLCTHQRCYRHSLEDVSCRQNEQFRKMFASWRKHQLPVSERGYQETLLDRGYFYLPIEHVLAGDLRYLKSIGADGYEYITTAPDAVYRKSMSPQLAETRRHAMYCLWQSLYVCGKMMWNTQLDHKKLLDDAGKCFYGKAWSAMKQFRMLLLEAYTGTEGHVIYGHPAVDIGRCLQRPGIKQQLLALLEKAEHLAADDPDPKTAKRLAAEKKYFMETWIRNARHFEKNIIRTSSAVKTSEPPPFDGRTSGKIWRKAAYTAGFPQPVSPPASPADIFMKAAFDDDNIYLALKGTIPAAGEKFQITFPDHSDLSLAPRCFDLDAGTPFRKNRTVIDGTVCYTLEIPRRFAGVDRNSAVFLFNASRIQHSQVCGKLYQTGYGCLSLGREGVRNGSFSAIAPVNPKRKNIKSKTFPAYWSFSGRSCRWNGKTLVVNGSVFQFLRISGGEHGGRLNVSVQAASADGGKATLRAHLSLCVRRPGERKKFRHDIRKNTAAKNISRNTLHQFSFELAPYETGYLYISGRNAAIRSITAAFDPETP